MAATTELGQSLACPSCDYSFQALTHSSCPECGKAFAIVSCEELQRKKRWFKPYLLGAISVPLLYLTFYLLLRITGVYTSSFSQGSWEVELDSNSEIVEALYLPLIYFESEMQFHFNWFHQEPMGC